MSIPAKNKQNHLLISILMSGVFGILNTEIHLSRKDYRDTVCKRKNRLFGVCKTSPEGACYSARPLSAGGVLRQIQSVKWSLINPDACRWA